MKFRGMKREIRQRIIITLKLNINRSISCLAEPIINFYRMYHAYVHFIQFINLHLIFVGIVERQICRFSCPFDAQGMKIVVALMNSQFAIPLYERAYRSRVARTHRVLTCIRDNQASLCHCLQ